MAWATWKPQKVQVCDRIGEQVALEVRVICPADILPDQPARVVGYRCSHAMECNCLDRPSCRWAGTLPGYDPFD
jgi:hypothetical protein